MSYPAYDVETGKYVTRTDYYTRYGLEKGVWFSASEPSTGLWNYLKYHTNRTYGFWLASVSIESPEPYTYTVEVPYTDGNIDLTDMIMDEPKYKTRKITIKLLANRAKADWPNMYTNIANDLHGKQMYAIFDDDANFYYHGRVSVTDHSVDGLKAWVTLEMEAEPYKHQITNYVSAMTTVYEDPNTGETETVSAWRWDILDMRYGLIIPYVYQGEGSDYVTIKIPSYKHGKLYVKIPSPTITGTPSVSYGSYIKIAEYDEWVEVCDINPSEGDTASVRTYSYAPFYVKVEDMDSL